MHHWSHTTTTHNLYTSVHHFPIPHLSTAKKNLATSESLQEQAILINKVNKVLYPPFRDTPFQFDLTKGAAVHNSKLLSKYNYDINKALNTIAPGTKLEYGSEFRPPSDPEPILHHHPLWSRTKAILLQGCNIKLSYQDPQVEREDLKLGLQCGNHKGAVSQAKDLTILIKKGRNIWLHPSSRNKISQTGGRRSLGSTQHTRTMEN